MSILNIENKTYDMSQPLFFGKRLGLQRYDQAKHKRLLNNFKGQLELFWRPEEINLSAARAEYKAMEPHEQRIFTLNLKYQTVLDSVQSRILKELSKDCSNLELEACLDWWGSFETLHSYSYSYIIKDVYDNPVAQFDDVYNDPEIVKRITSVTEKYNEYIDTLPSASLDERKKKLYISLVAMNILEGIRFYVSFACSYSFAQNKKMEGNAKIIRLINRDENLHLGMNQYIINQLRNDDTEGFKHIVAECEPMVYQMYKDAADEEIAWAEYLFKDGSFIGLNDQILTQYMKHLTNRRLKAIGLNHIFPETQNPISWIKFWTDSDAIQAAPQETENSKYLIGALTNDIDNVDYTQI